MLRVGITTVLLEIVCIALPQGSVALKDFTLPAGRLPSGCALSATSSERITEHTFHGGLWAGLRIPSNPWTGNDRLLIADIRERMEEAPVLPDAPALSVKELARYHLKLADGIDEGYAAVYREGTVPRLVTVYALRIAASQHPDAFGQRRTPLDGRMRVAIGQIIAVVSGGGVCFEAVADYVRSLT